MYKHLKGPQTKKKKQKKNRRNRAPDYKLFSTKNVFICFSYFSTKTYVMVTHQKHLSEALLMSTHVFMEK